MLNRNEKKFVVFGISCMVIIFLQLVVFDIIRNLENAELAIILAWGHGMLIVVFAFLARARLNKWGNEIKQNRLNKN